MSNIPISSLPLAIGLTADDEFVVVQGGTTKRVTLPTIASFINPTGSGVSAVISSGATPGSPYVVAPGIAKVLVDKTTGAATGILLNQASSYGGVPILIKDIKGDAATNNITISFSNGELVDGLSSLTLETNYAWVEITPYPLGGGFYLSNAG
jgi:hypothetical protein